MYPIYLPDGKMFEKIIKFVCFKIFTKNKLQRVQQNNLFIKKGTMITKVVYKRINIKLTTYLNIILQ